MKVLAITSGTIHPPLAGRFFLRHMMSKIDGIYIIDVDSMNALTRIEVEWFDAMVLYYHRQRISEKALEIFKGYVENGGGVLAIHSATASFKNTPGYFDVLGGSFRGHGPVETFEVKPSQPESKIFAGIPAFSIKDELYLHDFVADVDVHFYAEHEGEQAPMVWTHTYGKGRVCYACPGHRSAIMRRPEVREILKRGLDWVSGQ